MSVVGKTGLSQGVAPDADSGEEVKLSKSSKLIWNDISNVPFVNLARRDQASGDEIAEPLGCVGIVFIVACLSA